MNGVLIDIEVVNKDYRGILSAKNSLKCFCMYSLFNRVKYSSKCYFFHLRSVSQNPKCQLDCKKIINLCHDDSSNKEAFVKNEIKSSHLHGSRV